MKLYSVCNPRAAIIRTCPVCHGVNLLERTGQVKHEVELGAGVYCGEDYRWLHCLDCTSAFYWEEAGRVNRKRLTDGQLVRLEIAQACQNTREDLITSLKRLPLDGLYDPERLVEYWSKFFKEKNHVNEKGNNQ